jgi:hypothetical protein
VSKTSRSAPHTQRAGENTTFPYADGHVATHKWLDPLLITGSKRVGQGLSPFTAGGQIPSRIGADYDFIGVHYQFPLWQMPQPDLSDWQH